MSTEAKRLQILKGAEKLFTSRRFHEITMDDVAHAARVGKGTIYRYFADKDDLFFQLATAGFDELHALIRSGVPADGPLRDRLLTICGRIGEFHASRRPLLRMMQAEEDRMSFCKARIWKTFREGRDRIVQAVAEILAAGAEAGELRTDVPPKALAVALLGLMRSRARHLEDIPEPQRSPEKFLDLFLRGAACEAAATQAIERKGG